MPENPILTKSQLGSYLQGHWSVSDGTNITHMKAERAEFMNTGVSKEKRPPSWDIVSLIGGKVELSAFKETVVETGTIYIAGEDSTIGTVIDSTKTWSGEPETEIEVYRVVHNLGESEERDSLAKKVHARNDALKMALNEA